MQEQLKKLKKELDNLSIEKVIEITRQHIKSTVRYLWYLEKTKRFREYKDYEKQEFKVFIKEVFSMRYNDYRALAWAFNWYPKESESFGAQTLVDVRKAVKTSGVPGVIKQIKRETKGISDPNKRRAKIRGVVERYAPPPKKNENESDTKAYWKAQAEKWKADYLALKKAYDELVAQVERQKPSVRNWMKVKDIVSSPPAA